VLFMYGCDAVHIQGELKVVVDGGQPEIGPAAVVVGGTLVVVSCVFGCRVVVVELQLAKPIGLRENNSVPLEHLPLTKGKFAGSRIIQAKSQRLFKQSIGSNYYKYIFKEIDIQFIKRIFFLYFRECLSW